MTGNSGEGSSGNSFRHSQSERLSREGGPGGDVSSLPAHAPAGFAELCAVSNFTFLTGASHAEELVARAADLGLAALAVADRNTLAGVVRAHVAARELNARAAVAPPPPARRAPPVSNRDVAARWAEADQKQADQKQAALTAAEAEADPASASDPDPDPTRRRRLDNSDRATVTAEGPSVAAAPGWTGRFLVASRLALEDSPVAWIALPRDRAAYGRLCRLLTLGKRRAEKGACRLRRSDLLDWIAGEGAEESGAGFDLIALTPDPLASDPRAAEAAEHVADLARRLPGAVSLAARPAYDGRDDARLSAHAALARRTGAPMIATADPIMHSAGRRQLADILTCIRTRRRIDTLGALALPNAERRLRSEAEIRRLFGAHPDAISRTVTIAARCRFSLAELTYEYPDEVAIDPDTGQRMAPQQRLERLVREGLRERYPEGPPERARTQAEHELALIGRLDFARYFLTVRDVVAFARSRGILAQGRGSAANSIVCYALGVTAIGPEIASMVFERFVSEARGEPPDIDVDFEHERREEVIQHIYERYGRHRAGLCATVIHFRSRAAIREVGRAMGLSADAVSAIASQLWSWGDADLTEARLREIGLDPGDRRLRQTLRLASEIIGFPRHLSQHVGGFVMTQGRLDELVPIENAAMEDRTVIEWDKDDIDALGILKVDVLSLGMLTCIRKALDLVADHEGRRYTLASLPPEDPAVYEMLSRGDSVGVFQVESRAQMNFLPRMRPAKFYDLVIEVAIVRPGPIQGDMVHPYLRRRQGKEQVSFPSGELEGVLGKTLGVPLFQEQAMQIAIVAAGFSPEEADRLRRALATFRKSGTIHTFRERFVGGMVARGYEPDFAERCFSQIEGFGEYGFPESHAASFALLVYASAWLKRFHPAAFACALLNSQPMGFYAPAQIVRDARAHGVRVRPVSINASFHDCTLEPDGAGGLALRLGFRQIKGVSADSGARIASARGNGYADLDDLRRRSGIDRAALERLAEADVFTDLGLDRRAALWAAKAAAQKTLPLFDETLEGEGLVEPEIRLPEMSLGEQVVEDYRALRLSLRAHPLALLRPMLTPGDGAAGGRTPSPSPATGPSMAERRNRTPSPLTGEGWGGGAPDDRRAEPSAPARPTSAAAAAPDGSSTALPPQGGEGRIAAPSGIERTDGAPVAASSSAAGRDRTPSPLAGEGWGGGAPDDRRAEPSAPARPASAAASAPDGSRSDLPPPALPPQGGEARIAAPSGIERTDGAPVAASSSAAGRDRTPSPLVGEGWGGGAPADRRAEPSVPARLPSAAVAAPDGSRTALPPQGGEARIAAPSGIERTDGAPVAASSSAAGRDRTPSPLAGEGWGGGAPDDRRAEPSAPARPSSAAASAPDGSRSALPPPDLPAQGGEGREASGGRAAAVEAARSGDAGRASPPRPSGRPLPGPAWPRPPHSTPAAALVDAPARRRLSVTGLVIIRQRPGSAKGVIFITLEDETGSANVVVWQGVYERFRRAVITGRLLRVTGVIQREGEGAHAVIHLVAEKIEDLSPELDRLAAIGFDNVVAHADETRRPVMSRDPRIPKSQPRASQPSARHPRDQARRLFPSRDFH